MMISSTLRSFHAVFLIWCCILLLVYPNNKNNAFADGKKMSAIDRARARAAKHKVKVKMQTNNHIDDSHITTVTSSSSSSTLGPTNPRPPTHQKREHVAEYCIGLQQENDNLHKQLQELREEYSQQLQLRENQMIKMQAQIHDVQTRLDTMKRQQTVTKAETVALAQANIRYVNKNIYTVFTNCYTGIEMANHFQEGIGRLHFAVFFPLVYLSKEFHEQRKLYDWVNQHQKQIFFSNKRHPP